MTKENKEKIDILYNVIEEKCDELKIRYNDIKDRLYTSDMKEKILLLADHNITTIWIIDAISIRFITFENNETIFELSYLNGNVVEAIFPPDLNLDDKIYSYRTISKLEYVINNIVAIDSRIKCIEDHMEYIIRDINDIYNDCNEKESYKLDTLLSKLN